MQVIFNEGEADEAVLCDWGRSEESGLDLAFQDVVEQIVLNNSDSPEVAYIPRGGREVRINFSGARESASNAAAEDLIFSLAATLARAGTGTLTFKTSNNQGDTVIGTHVLTRAEVRITGTRRLGVTTFYSYAARGHIPEPSS